MTLAGKYQRYQCRSCGNWFRDNKNLKEKGQLRMINV